MKITLFTSNHPRHLSLIEDLSDICEELFVIQEVTTLYPGVFSDIYSASELHQAYFNKMHQSEEKYFGRARFLLKDNVRFFSAKSGDISHVEFEQLEPAFQSDYYVVFGASFIKNRLIDFLIENNAVNIHMGVSPYFRGAACNFWALYKRRPDMIGATIHLLSRGLDSGNMLFHALPVHARYQPFDIGMAAVRSAHKGLCHHIKNQTLFELSPKPQDKDKEILYTKKVEFDELVIKKFLDDMPTSDEVLSGLGEQNEDDFLRPFYG
ncbi:formyltransferase family protein [Neptunomonas sp.]|uniref:formyltransferase family protein n=1 Tax=Neptunomonas sp. TaxID=1971898 RepID=UPI003563264D